jgi:hypothetical protein
MAILQELLQAQADRLLSLAQDVRAKGKTDLADLLSSRAKRLVAEVTAAPTINSRNAPRYRADFPTYRSHASTAAGSTGTLQIRNLAVVEVATRIASLSTAIAWFSERASSQAAPVASRRPWAPLGAARRARASTSARARRAIKALSEGLHAVHHRQPLPHRQRP